MWTRPKPIGKPSCAKAWEAPAAPRSPWKSSFPARRPGTYEEVGELIGYLCTPSASYIHGQAINIDGGMVTEP